MAATLFWPLSARLAIRFLEYGCRVAALSPKGHYLRCIEGIERHLSYGVPGSLASLEQAIRKTRPAIVIPCDDRVVWQLHELYRRHPDLRSLLEESLGDPSAFEIIDRRADLLETAHSLGICIAKSRQITSEGDLAAWFAERNAMAVIKLDGTWGGEGVTIVRSTHDAEKAFRELSRPTGLMKSCKRLLVNGDPLSLWSRSRQRRPSMIIQEWIDGRPANSMLACWKGELLSMVSVEVLASEGITGAAFLVRVIEDKRMIADAQLLAAKLQLSGFCGLDYLLERTTGTPYLIEVNPRCTQLGHLPLSGGRDLAGALCAKLTGQHCESKGPSIEGRILAFFPQAKRWAARCSFPDGVYTDIPERHPKLLRELMLPVWPERRWISRLYHHYYPVRKAAPVEFDVRADEMPGIPRES